MMLTGLEIWMIVDQPQDIPDQWCSNQLEKQETVMCSTFDCGGEYIALESAAQEQS